MEIFFYAKCHKYVLALCAMSRNLTTFTIPRNLLSFVYSRDYFGIHFHIKFISKKKYFLKEESVVASTLAMKLKTKSQPDVTLRPADKDYLDRIYGSARGFVCVSSTADRAYEGDLSRKRAFVKSCCLKPDAAAMTANLRGTTRNNLMTSMCTYASRKNARESNALTVCALAVDVDFAGKFVGENPIEVWRFIFSHLCEKYFVGERVAFPQFVEVGHRLRLIYALEPVCLAIKPASKRVRTIRWIKKISRELTAMVNSIDADLCAEVQNPNKSVRFPNSKNVKWDGKMYGGKFIGEPEVHHVSVFEVELDCIPEKYEIHELSDIILEPLGDWYDPNYYSRKKRKNDLKTTSVEALMDGRMRKGTIKAIAK